MHAYKMLKLLSSIFDSAVPSAEKPILDLEASLGTKSFIIEFINKIEIKKIFIK